MVYPSFLRSYNDPALQLVWGRAAEEFVRASRWVFIGYSLPPADVHLRELLRDSLRCRRERHEETDICVVGRQSGEELAQMVAAYVATFGSDIRAWNATANGFGDFPAALDP